MTLRSKISVVLAACLAATVVTHHMIGQLIVQREFESLEQEQAARHVEVVKHAIEQRVSEVGLVCKDWAFWDDTYEFVQQYDEEYYDSNLTREAFTNLKFHLIHFYDARGRLVWGETRDPESGELIEIAGFPPEGFPADSPLVRHASESDSVVGLVRIGQRIITLASFPVLTSENQGPIQGTIVMGRLIPENDAAWLRDQTKVKVALTPLAVGEAGPAPGGASVWFEEAEAGWLRVCSQVDDAFGDPLVLLKLDLPRKVSAQGRQALWHATSNILLLSILLLTATWLGLHHLFVDPVRNINRSLDEVASGNLASRIEKPGADELGQIARACNQMTESLQRHRDHLEELVEQRTAELSRANASLTQEVAERKRAQQRLATFERFVESSGEGMGWSDLDGKLEYVNATLLAMFAETDREEIYGKPAANYYDGQTQRRFAEEILPALLKQGSWSGELVVVSRRGRKTPTMNSFVVQRDEQGNPVRISHVLTDMTLQKAVERKLRQNAEDLEIAGRAAEAASQAKSEFLANMSHELRTPLHGILSYATFGEKKWETARREKLRDYFQRINRGGALLLGFVDNLLDLAKLEAGKAFLEPRKVDLYTLALDLADELRSLLDHRKITLVCLKPEFDVTVTADRGKMGQVLRNLLSNAAKFSPLGGHVEIAFRQTDGRSVRVDVCDRGVGIPADELETVFDKFVQSSATESGAGGTGLGLAICREIVIAHQGLVWAENRQGGGAAFCFELPYQSQDAIDTRRLAESTAEQTVATS